MPSDLVPGDNDIPIEVQERNGVSEKIGYERRIHSCLTNKFKQNTGKGREGRYNMSTTRRNASMGIRYPILPRAKIVFKRPATHVTKRGR